MSKSTLNTSNYFFYMYRTLYMMTMICIDIYYNPYYHIYD